MQPNTRTKWQAFPERTDHAVTEWTTAFNTRFAQLARADEREARAIICDGYTDHSAHPMNFAENCAAAIRSRKDDE